MTALRSPKAARRVTVETEASVYRFNWESGDWALATVHDETGMLAIASSYGAWAFVWSQPGRGSGSLHDFLAGSSGDYVASKMVEHNGRRAAIETREVRGFLGTIWPELRDALRAEVARRAGGNQPHGLDTDTRVRFYEHDFYVLSNFSAFTVDWLGHRFATAEHAYQWMKFPGLPLQEEIRLAPSAHTAFKLGQTYRTAQRADWDSVRVGLMRLLLGAKVDQHDYVRRKLLATGDRELVEDSWRDDFWGWGPNRDGKNMLGQLWMEIRATLRGEP